MVAKEQDHHSDDDAEAEGGQAVRDKRGSAGASERGGCACAKEDEAVGAEAFRERLREAGVH